MLHVVLQHLLVLYCMYGAHVVWLVQVWLVWLDELFGRCQIETSKSRRSRTREYEAPRSEEWALLFGPVLFVQLTYLVEKRSRQRSKIRGQST